MNEKMIGTLRQMERGIIDDVHEVVATGLLTEAEAATVQWLWEEWGTTELHGTKIHKPATPAERIAAFRSIVEEKQYAKIDGVMVDLFTASVVVQVYDALSAENKARFEKFGDAPAMAAIAFKVLKRAEGK